MADPATRGGHRSCGTGAHLLCVGVGRVPDLTDVLLVGQTMNSSGWTPRARGNTSRTSDEARWHKYASTTVPCAKQAPLRGDQTVHLYPRPYMQKAHL